MSYAMLKIGAMAVNLNLLSSDFFALLVGLFVFQYTVSVSSILVCVHNGTLMSNVMLATFVKYVLVIVL